MPGCLDSRSFTASSEAPADHPFVCTYPGHWRVMNGVMHVVDTVGDGPRVTRRATVESAAPAREFVQDWRMEDLAPLLVDGWERGRSAERGRELFSAAGCIKCHTVQGEGALAGPELTKIREKYSGQELLRHVVEPSFEVLEGYAFLSFEFDDGTFMVGRVLEDDGQDLHVLETLLLPDEVTLIAKDEIVSQYDTKLSPMPSGLLVTLTVEEILDLLYFLQPP